MIIKNISRPRYLRNYGNQSEYNDFNIIDERLVTKTVIHRLPLFPCAHCLEKGGYLENYAQYYDLSEYRFDGKLKEEYRNERPTYSIEVTFKRYDIELTKKGEDFARSRYESHKRNLETYAHLLGINN